MAVTAAELQMILTAKDQASRVLKQVQGQTQRTSKEMSLLAKTAKAAGVALAGLAVVGVAALAKGLYDCASAASEAEQVQASLNAVLKSTGGVAGVTADMANALAESLSTVTRFDDEAIVSAEALLLTFTQIGKDVFPAATETMLNMSQVLGTDLSSSARMLGRALANPAEGLSALTRVGVTFTKAQEDQIKALQKSGDLMGAQKIILAALEVKFGGAAKAAGDTFAGKMDILNTKIGNLKETIGMALIPALSDIASQFITVISSPAVQNAITKVAGWLTGTLIPAVGDVIRTAGNISETLMKALTTGNWTFIGNLLRLKIWAMLEQAKDIGADFWDFLKNLPETSADNVQAVADAYASPAMQTAMRVAGEQQGATAGAGARQAIVDFFTNDVEGKAAVVAWFTGAGDAGTQSFGDFMSQVGNSDITAAIVSAFLGPGAPIVIDAAKAGALTGAIAWAGAFVSGLFGPGWAWLSAGLTGLGESISAWWAGIDLSGTGKHLIDEATRGINTNWTTFTTRLTVLGAQIGSWWETLDLSATGVYLIDQLKEGVDSTLKDAEAWFSELGANIVSGVTTGITDAWASLGGAAEWAKNNIIRPLVTGSEEEAETQSPSKVFHGIGVYIVEGLRNGIADTAGEAVAAIRDLGRGVVDGFNQGIGDKVASMVGAVKNMVNVAHASAQIALLAHSPSQLFVPLGQSIGLGLIQGMQSVQGQVTSAAKDVIDSTFKTWYDGIKSQFGSSGASNIRRIFQSWMREWLAGATVQVGETTGQVVARMLQAATAQFGPGIASILQKFGGQWQALLGAAGGLSASGSMFGGLDSIMGALGTVGGLGSAAASRYEEKSIAPLREQLRLLEEQGTKLTMIASLKAEIAKREEKLTALAKQQSNLQWLQAQIDLVKLIKENGLSTSVLGGLKLGLNADPAAILDAMTRAMDLMLTRAQTTLGGLGVPIAASSTRTTNVNLTANYPQQSQASLVQDARLLQMVYG